MLFQSSNLQNFVSNYLSDVIDWRKNVLPANDPSLKDKVEREFQMPTSGDQAHVIISTDYNRYYLSSASMYVEPPHGAPMECKTLGTIIFEELTADKDPVRIVRARQDQTFIDIAKQIRKSELKGCLKDVRRQLAECADDELKKTLLGRIPVLASKAKEYGLDIAGLPGIGDLQSIVAMPNVAVGETIRQVQEAKSSMDRADVEAKHVAAVPVPEELYIGAPVVYITNPGEAIGGQREIPGIVNKIHAGDVIGGVFFPDHSEVMHKDRLQRRNAEKIRMNCWDFQSNYAAMLSKHKEMTLRIRSLEENVVQTVIAEGMKRLEQRIIELDQAAKVVVDAAVGPLKERLDILTNSVLDLQTRPEPAKKAKG